MTKETQKLLIIDDNPQYLLAGYKAATERGYEVDVAFDLEDAMIKLQSETYTGIITDLQFCERGLSTSSKVNQYVKDKDDLEDIAGSTFVSGMRLCRRGDESIEEFREREKEAKDLFKGNPVYEKLIEALKRTKIEQSTSSLWYYPQEDFQLRTKIAEELSIPEIAEQMTKLGKTYGYNQNEIAPNYNTKWGPRREGCDDITIEEAIRIDIKKSPALGYEVIKYAQEHEIPFVVVSSLGHGDHCLPALLGTGLTTVDEIIGVYQAGERDYIPLLDYLREQGLTEEDIIALRAKFMETSARIMDKSTNLQDKIQQNLSDERVSKSIHEDQKRYAQLDEVGKQRMLISEIIPQHDHLFFDQVILPMSSKDQQTYHFAIDILERKFAETRPYRMK